MIKAEKYLGGLEKSSGICGIVLADDGKKWAVRAKKRVMNEVMNSTRLFNEYAAGILSSEIGFSKPKVELIELTDEVIEKAEKKHLKSDNFRIDNKIAVGTEYIEGLKTVEGAKYFSDENSDPFYAYCIFAEWIFLNEEKSENLLVAPNGELIFLDFDVSFSGLSYDHSIPDTYDWYVMKSHTIFREVIIWEIERFEDWFQKIRECNQEKITNLLYELPESWEIPNGYREKVITTLLKNREQFIEEFTYLIDDMRNEY